MTHRVFVLNPVTMVPKAMKSVPVPSRKWPGLHDMSDEACEAQIAHWGAAEINDITKQVLTVEPSVGMLGIKIEPRLGINVWGHVVGGSKVEFKVRGEVFTYWLDLGEDNFRDLHLQRLMEKMERRARHYA